VKDSSVPRNGSSKASPEWSTYGGAVERTPTIPKDGTHLLAACATPGRLDQFSVLALQQHGQQSALRKGRRWRHNVVFAVFHKRLFILRFDSSPDGFPYGTLVLFS
jgi:hypothetical protein